MLRPSEQLRWRLEVEVERREFSDVIKELQRENTSLRRQLDEHKVVSASTKRSLEQDTCNQLLQNRRQECD